MIAIPWFKRRRLGTSPVMIATSLHQMVERDDPQVAPETLHLPDAVRTRFREKVRLYREANILLALADRVNPSREGSDPLFEPVFWEYERIIFWELPRIFGESPNPDRAARRQSVTVAVQDLNARMHPPSMGNRYEIAREWSRTWFAGIGHKEMNPMTLAMFFSFWASEYTAVQKGLEAAAKTNLRLFDLSFIKRRFFIPWSGG
jgi:hypothetical protein